MFSVLPLNSEIAKLIKKHNLEKKFNKQIKLFLENPKHPGLNLELLEPKQHGVYSIRIDRKFRALLIFLPDHEFVEILTITVHYH